MAVLMYECVCVWVEKNLYRKNTYICMLGEKRSDDEKPAREMEMGNNVQNLNMFK